MAVLHLILHVTVKERAIGAYMALTGAELGGGAGEPLGLDEMIDALLSHRWAKLTINHELADPADPNQRGCGHCSSAVRGPEERESPRRSKDRLSSETQRDADRLSEVKRTFVRGDSSLGRGCPP